MRYLNAKHTNARQEIERLLVGRVALEQELARALRREFANAELHATIHAAVWRAMEFLAFVRDSGSAADASIVPWLRELEARNHYLFPCLPRIDGVRAELALGRDLTPEQCGNLIRFYGEVVERFAARSAFWRRQRALQIGWRYGGGGEAFRSHMDPMHVAEADRGSVWQKKVVEGGPTGGRIRSKGAHALRPYHDLVPGNLFENETMRSIHVGKKGGGVLAWNIDDASTIGRIDRAFGLPFGADISGTTTDNLYFLTGWADISSGDPLVMMLPLAVIVGEYHHTLLEVAAAMSLRKVIGYCIGFYTTLLPALPAGPRVRKAPQRDAVAATLRSFESDARNQHVLLHYVDRKVAGCFVAEEADVAAYRRLATVDVRMWPRFNSLDAYPTEANVLGLLNEVGLADAAFASRRGALQRA